MKSLAGCDSTLKDSVKPGKKALPQAHAKRIGVTIPHEILSSVDFDNSVQKKYPEHARWDYLLEIRVTPQLRSTYAVEFHSIELSKVLKKQSDTQSILLQLCDPKPTVDRWILVPEGSTSSASRQTVLKLAQKGIEVSRRMLQL